LRRGPQFLLSAHARISSIVIGIPPAIQMLPESYTDRCLPSSFELPAEVASVH
jgi:hypothetical protein